jgi:hypothetical protein
MISGHRRQQGMQSQPIAVVETLAAAPLADCLSRHLLAHAALNAILFGVIIA